MDWFLYDNGLCHERVEYHLMEKRVKYKRLNKLYNKITKNILNQKSVFLLSDLLDDLLKT